MADLDPTFTLIPPEETLTPEDDLAAAIQSALENPFELEEAEDVIEPFGRTVAFDWERGVMKRNGTSPMWVTGLGALREWVMMALHSAWLAHPVFTDEFGVENPEGVIGLGSLPDIDAAASDFGASLETAVLVHDRVVAFEDYMAEFLNEEGILHVIQFEIITDETERLRFEGIDLATVPEV